MRTINARLPLLAFCTSLLVHAMLLCALPLVIDAAAPRLSAAAHDELASVPILPQEVQLGLDEQLPPNDAWLGDIQLQVHLAQHDVIDQAAFTEQSTALPVLREVPAPRPAPPAPEDALHQDRHSTPATGEMDVLATSQIAPPLQASPAIEPAAAAMLDRTPVLDPADLLVSLIRDQMHESGSHASDQTASEQATRQSPATTSVAGEAGTPSDKQSSPTSVVEVPRDHWRLGKPLVGSGLELKPRRPEFTLLTLLTASPANPLCQIDFDREGVPVKAALLTTTGDRRVDDALLASLYRWRATGQPLQDIAEGQTLSVKIRILLTRNAS